VHFSVDGSKVAALWLLDSLPDTARSRLGFPARSTPELHVCDKEQSCSCVRIARGSCKRSNKGKRNR
jgi:hypothetical protein